MRYTPELLDEMAEAFTPCTCNECAMRDSDYVFMITELSWEEMGL